MKKVILLSRVSTLSQDLYQQTEEVMKAIKADGYADEQIILIEDKESATMLSEEERLGLNKMKDHIEKDDVECVYVYEISRLSRRPEVLYSIRNYLVDKGINLKVLKPSMTLLENGKISEAANIMFAIFGAMAEQEGYIRKERLKRGKVNKQKNGKFVGGYMLYGYTTDKDRNIIVDEEKAEIVKMIFHKYAYENKSLKAIGREMNELGYITSTTHSGELAKIRQMVLNPAYTGRPGITFGSTDHHISNYKYPRIISDELWEKCQEVYKQRFAGEKANINHVYYCRGLLVDGRTGYKLGPACTCVTYKNITQKLHDPNPVVAYISINILDSVVWSVVKDYKIETLPEVIAERKKSMISERADMVKKAGVANKKVPVLEAKLLKIQERIIDGKLDENIGDLMAEKINAEIDACKESFIDWMFKIKHIDEMIKRLETGADDINDLNSLEDEEIEALIKDCVSRIELWPRRDLGIKINDILIKFIDGTERTIRVNSANRKAIDVVTGEPYSFEYLRRFDHGKWGKQYWKERRDIKKQKMSEEK